MSKKVRNSFLFLALSLGVTLSAYAQFSKTIKFNGGITDEEGGEDPTFIVFEEATDIAEIEYVAGVDDQAVYLDSADGFKFPMELTDAMMASDLWSFQMRFKITDWGAGDGNRMLINLKRAGTGTGPWFEVYASKSSDTEGRMVWRMFDRTTRVQQYAFYFNLNEWVNLSLTIDFAAMNYILAGDSYYISGNYEDFDYETFKTYGSSTTSTSNSLQDRQFHVGYYQNLKNNHLSTNPVYSNDYSGDLVIDNLVISTSAPATDVSVYETALIQLTDHLNGVITLTDSEISAYTSEILTNYKDNYLEVKETVSAYFAAYEAKYEPIFSKNVGELIFEDYDEFGWITFTLQQDVHDNYFTNEHIEEVAGLAFEAADAFPGPVAETAERLTGEIVTINGTYIADPGYNVKILQDDYGTFARRPTGLYVPPGEAITVIVPDALVGIGADIVIGASTHDVSNKLGTGLRRFPRVIKEYEIYQSTMTVANPFGGILYIYIPEGTDLGGITITVSGAVKMPYFPMTSLKTGDITAFQERVASGEVLFAEVETDNFMYTAPLSYFKRDDIVETLEMWDRMWEAYQMYNGRPFPLHKSEHYIIDRMTKWNTLAGGYPMTMGANNVPNTTLFWAQDVNGNNMMDILDFDNVIRDSKATYWHEMSHHTGLPTMGNELEVIVEVAYVAVHNVGWGMPLDSAMKYSERGFYTRDEAIIDWVVMPDFRTNQEMPKVTKHYQQRGYSKYVDIAVLFGWEGLGSINKVFYDQWTAIGGQVNDPEKNIITDSEWHLASAYALNQNVSPLYHFWGEQPDASIIDSLNTYPRSKEAYLRIREIRDFIPKTVEEFQPYYDAHAPTNTSSQNYQPYSDALVGWNSNLFYDSLIMQIDSILYWYYDGDFDQDGYLFYDDCDDTDASIRPYDLVHELEACVEFEFDGDIITTSGVYNGSFTTLAGCDSLVTLNLTILEPTSSAILETVCDSYDFLGSTLTSSGIYNQVIANSVGCDSLITLDLTILNSSISEETVQTCEPYAWNGTTYSVSGTYETLLTNTVGCDSTATLHLTINQTIETVLNEMACGQYDFVGDILTSSGTYDKLLTSFHGCDSLVTLNLILSESFTKEETITKCDSYTWLDSTYFESGNYIKAFSSTAGCDSTYSLNLTILNSSSGELDVEACDSYEWNRVLYTKSGSYLNILRNSVGCDSLATLNLTIHDSSIDVFCFDSTITEVTDELGSEIILFPNPTSGNISIDLGGRYEAINVEVISLTGRLISQRKYYATDHVSMILDAPAGNYFIRITRDNLEPTNHLLSKTM